MLFGVLLAFVTSGEWRCITSLVFWYPGAGWPASIFHNSNPASASLLAAGTSLLAASASLLAASASSTTSMSLRNAIFVVVVVFCLIFFHFIYFLKLLLLGSCCLLWHQENDIAYCITSFVFWYPDILVQAGQHTFTTPMQQVPPCWQQVPSCMHLMQPQQQVCPSGMQFFFLFLFLFFLI